MTSIVERSDPDDDLASTALRAPSRPADTDRRADGPAEGHDGALVERLAAGIAGDSAGSRVPQRQWSRQYLLQLLATDALCAAVAVTVGWGVRYGFATESSTNSYLFLAVALTCGWLLALQAVGAYDVRRISTGSREYQRVLRAALNVAGATAIVAYLTQILVARTFVALVIPIGAVLMLLARYALRQSVHARRLRGGWNSAILAVGTRESVAHMAHILSRSPQAGLVVRGACVEDAAVGEEIVPGVQVVGDVAHAADLARRLGVDVVAVASTGLGPRRIRELGWALEGTDCSMVMAPGLTEVAGPRVHVSPVEGLPLVWVDSPRFTGLRRVVKRTLDVVGASVLLLFATPLLAVAAVAVKLDSRGPVLFRQRRLGKDGTQFRMIKFRSMCVDAEAKREELLHLNEAADDKHLYFKIKEDPRITRVGRVLRKYSVDELPQLMNVLRGEMSLVGPRPLPGELDEHDGDFRRRLRVKPGLTGLWQVSGRSELSADDAVRLDLYYVENWSLALDLAIIARTVLVVLRSRGAY